MVTTEQGISSSHRLSQTLGKCWEPADVIKTHIPRDGSIVEEDVDIITLPVATRQETTMGRVGSIWLVS